MRNTQRDGAPSKYLPFNAESLHSLANNAATGNVRHVRLLLLWVVESDPEGEHEAYRVVMLQRSEAIRSLEILLTHSCSVLRVKKRH